MIPNLGHLTLPLSHPQKKKLIERPALVVKLGGSTLNYCSILDSIADDLKLIASAGMFVIMVHGGGPLINRELTRRGIQWEFLEGQRITTPEVMEIIEMVLSGFVNRKIVKSLQAQGILAAGISGIDGMTLLCKQADSRLGQVGE